MQRLLFAGVCAVLLMSMTACSAPDKEIPAPTGSSSKPATTQPDWSAIPGALVETNMESEVGVVLDEIPQNQREKLLESLMQKPKAFWVDRAKRQIRLTSLRLSFRTRRGEGSQLPLPPEELRNIEIPDAPRRHTIDGHDAVTVRYRFSGMLLTDEASPGITEPALGNIGGTWNEPFIFPVDPEFIFQRTGYACMNEAQFPPNSMDAEESDLFYDHTCKVEANLTNTACHQTQMPTMSCIDALTKKIGKVKTAMRFERLSWDPVLADRIRLGEITNPTGADLVPDREEFLKHRLTYRYIPGDSCTVKEKCVGGVGWRHLLQFPTADLNAGAAALEIGLVDYFRQHGGSTLSEHGVFEFSACHRHYHFSHYGSFTLGGSQSITRKNGFCMQPTARVWNNELSPLHHPYTDCLRQGVSVGWIDEYKMGLECQWLDVTDVRPNELPLSFETNPDGFLCEGTPQPDAQGKQMFEPTEFKTSAGGPVDKPVCDFYPQWAENNTESYPVYIPPAGESYVTDDCSEGFFGPLRNCGFKNKKKLQECTPGGTVTISCSVPAGSAPHIIRFCEASREFNTGIPCTYNDALGSAVIENQKDVTFTCPSARDDIETGGGYSYLTGPLIPGEGEAEVTCTAKE